jgi:ureidoacrylate peracid hydrolase
VNPAMIIVDMQNDFIHADGYMARMMKENPSFDLKFYASPIPFIKRLAAAFRTAGKPVVYIAMVLSPDYSDACFPYWRFPEAVERQFLVEGTWGARIVDELTPAQDDHVVIKKGYSGFYNTELEPMLRRLGVDTCVFTGVGLDVCVSSTLRDAVRRMFKAIVVSDATGSFSRQAHEATLAGLRHPFADIMTTQEVIEMSTSFPAA